MLLGHNELLSLRDLCSVKSSCLFPKDGGGSTSFRQPWTMRATGDVARHRTGASTPFTPAHVNTLKCTRAQAQLVCTLINVIEKQ